MVQPDEIGGLETQSCYLVVADADRHCATARAAGAEIIFDVQEDAEGGRGYTCRDPEGHIWSFGTFDPWREQPRDPGATAVRPRRFTVLTLLLLLGVFAGGLTTSWMYLKSQRYQEQIATLATLQALPAPTPDREQAARVQLLQQKLEGRIAEFERQLAEARRRQDVAEASLKQAQAQLASEQSARQSAERLTRDLREQIARDAAAMQAIASSARTFEGRLVQSRSAWTPAVSDSTALPAEGDKAAPEPAEIQAIEQTIRELRAELARERQARLAAEAALGEARREIGRRRAASAQD
jgi:hypothetical protein